MYLVFFDAVGTLGRSSRIVYIMVKIGLGVRYVVKFCDLIRSDRLQCFLFEGGQRMKRFGQKYFMFSQCRRHCTLYGWIQLWVLSLAVCAPRAVAETFEDDALLLAKAVDTTISMLHPHWRKAVEDHLASAQRSGLIHVLKVHAWLARINCCTVHYLVCRADGKSITNTS